MPKAMIDPESHRPNTVALDSHALGTLQYIRASIDAAGLLAVPGSAGIAMGAVGVLAALLASIRALAGAWLQIWLVAGLVAVAFGTALMIHQVIRRGNRLVPRAAAQVSDVSVSAAGGGCSPDLAALAARRFHDDPRHLATHVRLRGDGCQYP